jgi:hypothetical protein
MGIVVPSRQSRDEEGPAGKADELHDGCEDADHGRGGDDGQAVAVEHLPEEDGERCEQDGRQHEAVPEKLETGSPRLEAAQDVFGWAAQDVRVVEASREEEEEQVERERQDDQENTGGVLHVHCVA